MPKTICILPQKIASGGPGSFQFRLMTVLAERGYRLNHDPLDPANTAILVIGGTRQLALLNRAKRNGVRIVQRLNGMNWVHRQTRTGLKHFLRSEVNNWILSTIRQNADRIVYQSKFSRQWWMNVYGETQSLDDVVYNGVDLDQFTPLGVGSPPAKFLRILLVEGHIGSGYEQGLDSVVRMTRLLAERLDQKAQLMVVGKISEETKQQFRGQNIEIIWRGRVKREEIPQIDRSAHLFFSSDVNAACPNSVIEALACGLPVVGYDTGSLSELLAEGAGCTAAYGADPWKLQKPDIHTLADAAQKVLANRQQFQKAARARAEKMFDIQHVADQYLDALLK